MAQVKGETFYLVVADPVAVVEFCEAVFGAERLPVIGDADRVQHVECRVDDTVLMIGGMEGGPDAMVHVYVPDPYATMEQALAHGAMEIQPVGESGDGDRRGGFRTPCGTQWFVACQV